MADHQQEERPSPPWSLTKILVVVIGACCFVSAAVNVFHAHNTFEETALHGAMHEFLQGGAINNIKAKMNTPQEAAVMNHDEEEEPHERGHHAMDEEPAEQEAEAPSYLAHLSCEKYGGPANEDAQEMVYWQDIPSDSHYVSPFHAKHGQHKRYMTFEPDGGGWNNIRMAMETVLGLAIASARTLVLPPEQHMYLLGKDRGKDRSKQQKTFSFADFFPMEELARDNDGLEMITMREFLETEALTGNMRDKVTKRVSFPPDNRTEWSGQDQKPLKEWLRNVTHTPLWSPGRCMAAFPASGDHKDVETLESIRQQIQSNGKHLENFLDDPPPVDASTMERMHENIAQRNELCVYDEEMQAEKYVHFMCYHKMRVRMLVHFYAFLFFEDWREDLWMKRFMRDHVRYTDEIQCAAGRVVHAMREHARERDPVGNPDGDFDTFHIRRGDFQFKKTRISSQEIYNNTRDVIHANASVYIATDERDKSFFDDMRKEYDLMFLDDFAPELEGINTNYYGMIDQLVASRGRQFFGCWHSTFTGFIARIRGYHSVKEKSPGYEKGLLPDSYYYATLPNKFVMHKYARLHGAFFNREFPTSWRDLDKGIGHLPNTFQDTPQ